MEITNINAKDVLDTCYKLIQGARKKACQEGYHANYPVYIVLPVLQDRALRYYLARNPGEQMSAMGTLVPSGRYLFGATKLTSDIIEEPIVY